ncbi:mycofactocin-coupled SDR family oxidoreductase [Nocardia sp. BSTN01]|uniref:mycofactocin-coupled SDR family oxidoreductase n=1 Tax=Nocardia sp. BSTN01 TaxID=2783665 RepID=UPI00188E7785|nr:mycofactocin-coupled SDR family oxidoreductase [Nocardia sp. BSTN01]MBF4997354.1 mycofactocin-coupled SDR family oxidoreductase [Nocardia sp. BSTN01]
MGRVENKVAFITGAARGQARAHAIRLAEEGADIIGVDSLAADPYASYPMGTQADLDETIALVEKAGRRMIGVKADVRDRAALQAALDQGLAEFGRLDIVCASAGISPPGRPLWEIDPAQWSGVLDVNLTGVFNTLAVTVPALVAAGNGGSIVLTASGAGLKSPQNLGDYNASKAGVVALGKTLANELAAQRIRVNVIAPGTVGTPMVTENEETFKLFRPDLENPTLEDARPVFAMMMPMGEPWVDPVDIANAVLFFASDEARFVTGQVLAVDEGMTNKAF